MSEDPNLQDVSDEHVAKLGINHPDKLYLIIWMIRPRVDVFVQELEYGHFPPGTALNDLFQMYILKRPQDEHFPSWSIVEVPMVSRPIVDALLAKHRLRRADGIPRLIRKRGDETLSFPVIDSPNIFTVENL